MENDVRPFTLHRQGHREADALRTAGDQNRFALQLHVGSKGNYKSTMSSSSEMPTRSDRNSISFLRLRLTPVFTEAMT